MATWWKYCFSNMRISTSNSIWHAIEGRSGLISTISTVEAQIVTIIMHGRKLHAGCIDPLALGPSISLLRLALCAFCWIRQGEDDRSFTHSRNSLNDSMTAWVNVLPTILPPIRTLALTRFAFVSIVADLTKEKEVVARWIKAGLEDNALQDENIRNKWMSILTLSTK